ncbi:universal stress protein [Arthrobacter sp. D1-17]
MMDTKGKVVVGVDGSESSVQALRLAARLAPALEAAIHAVAVWELPPVYADETGYVPPDFDAMEAIDAAEAAEKKILADTVAKAFGTDVPRNLSQELIRGPARDKLVEAGAGAALLVVGRRGHGGFLGMHIGSVSSACVSHADCPVLVVHSDGEVQVEGSPRPHHLWKSSKTKGQDPSKP